MEYGGNPVIFKHHLMYMAIIPPKDVKIKTAVDVPTARYYY